MSKTAADDQEPEDYDNSLNTAEYELPPIEPETVWDSHSYLHTYFELQEWDDSNDRWLVVETNIAYEMGAIETGFRLTEDSQWRRHLRVVKYSVWTVPQPPTE